MNQYYEAYDKRYRQIHAQNLEWSPQGHSPILDEVIGRYNICKESTVLELGCGEGRDAFYLLNQGYSVCASDVSSEAVRFCQQKFPEFSDHFMELNACGDDLDKTFDFIYSIAVLHMLVLDADRDQFLTFIQTHLSEKGIALILTMGDGNMERASDVSRAFCDSPRIHGETGQQVQVAETSCRIVNFDTLEAELTRNGFQILEKGITEIPQHFPMIMYAIVQKA